ncbi:serine/threonine protein kinase [Carnobacterium iners]|uniref:non-specific serine/threonine protein kinase n=1 Tax=Carnobacterium iners TaxID=1073423 RepID=A0A1X7NLB6_9LACT|nr:Stk1 family PASTA domain-containing Ser/Thr kinase [Carnobacterium iners]SEK83861.1 serine/threonine protein kinase [Carnobacterium iners]SMH37955.1 serine/threonine protein kinase [Carnobacterium iners]
MQIGTKLNGRYKIIGTVGGGGMAHVYLAHDLILDRDVAVKVLRYDFRDDQDTIRRFKREALAATELVHPNIVSVYDIGEEDDNQYIVMEYVKGMDLKKYIHTNFPIPYQKVTHIMDQVLSAVAAAHHNRIIHRDLKPQNILIDESGIVKITDFGIAVALSQTSITQTNSLLGSVHYLSPEQARGGMATNQSDIYSLGIILYELLTGHVPFDGESAVSIALKHFQETVPSVKSYDQRIPQALENVVLKATAKEVADRYKTIYEMQNDLATALSADRRDEAKYIPVSMMETTKILEPIPLVIKDSKVEAKTQENERLDNKQLKNNEKSNKVQTKKSKKRKVLLSIALALFLLSIGLFFLIANSAPKDVTVPDITDMTENEATKVLSEKKLLLGKVTKEADDDIEEGLIIKSKPKVGLSVKENTPIDVVISSGKVTFKFLDYTGESYEEIQAQLNEQNFTVEREDQSSDTIEAGLIISQNINENEVVIPEDITVTFVVSTGQAGFEMRDLSGYTEKSVRDYVNDNELNVTITKEYSAEVAEGQVISQNPAAGTILYAGKDISVVLSQGPKEIPAKTVNKRIDISYKKLQEIDSSGNDEESVEPNTLPNLITIYIEDKEHKLETVYQQFEISEDTEIDLPFVLEEGKKGRYKVVRDGETIEEDEVSP